VTEQESSSSSEPSSSLAVFKAIIAIGVMGTEEDAARFTALWITDSNLRAHRIAEKIMKGRVQLLPLPETE
jgi:hypothetical protein